MTTRLLLIRHGESIWNSERRWQGRANPPLSPLGRRQAERIADALSKASLVAIYSSPLSRALETARAIAEPHGLCVAVVDDLMEVDVGAWQGLSVAEVEERYPEALQRWRAALDHAPGGESLQAAAERGEGAIRKIVASHPEMTVAVVTHGALGRLALSRLTNRPHQVPGALFFRNAAIAEIEFGEVPEIVRLNDTSH